MKKVASSFHALVVIALLQFGLIPAFADQGCSPSERQGYFNGCLGRFDSPSRTTCTEFVNNMCADTELGRQSRKWDRDRRNSITSSNVHAETKTGTYSNNSKNIRETSVCQGGGPANNQGQCCLRFEGQTTENNGDTTYYYLNFSNFCDKTLTVMGVTNSGKEVYGGIIAGTKGSINCNNHRYGARCSGFSTWEWRP